MQSLSIIVLVVFVGVSHAAPGGIVTYAALPAPSADTKVFRDYLGNQATSYAYQDGHSSAVALSRNDVSNHLVAAPAAVTYAAAPVAVPAPVTYAAAPVAYAAPQVVHAAAPVYTASSYQYHHRYPSYTAYAAPAYVL